MKLYYSLLTGIAILWGLTVPIAMAETSLPSPQITKMPEKLADFNAISIRGPVKVLIEQIPEPGDNFFQMPAKQHSPVSVKIKNNTLYIEADESRQTTQVNVGLYQLNQLMIDGEASVNSHHLISSSLSIDANTSGTIDLSGMITLDRLLTSGKGLIRIQWINSPRLRIDASSNSQIELAGVAGSVEMRLRDQSEFQGQYLRIDRIFVQTKDSSNAKLLVNDSLRAFAYDHSNIYYYKRPAELTEFTAGSGNILQLGWGQ